MDIQSNRLVGQLSTLMELSALVNSTLSSAEIKRRSIEAAASLLDAERGSLLLLDEDTGELCFEVALGDAGEALKEVRLAPGEGIAGWCAQNDEPLVINDPRSDTRFFCGADDVSKYVTRSIVCVPVKAKGRIIGVLEALNRNHGEFGEEDVALLSALGNQVAVAIENATLYEQLRETFFETAAALADTVEKRDPYTGGHTKRVMLYTAHIAEEMGLPEDEIANLRLAAILHDIGKVGIPDEILLKNGDLTPEEGETMRRHATIAAEIMGHVKKLGPIMPGVRWHHERLDGSGYPDGLTAEELPLGARIVAVADAFDAMTTVRPYRDAMCVEEALDELKRCSGTQFDGDVVDAFARLMSASQNVGSGERGFTDN